MQNSWGGVFAFLHRTLRGYKPYKGGILIEFAFSIPVFIILLFFVSDHYRIYELKNKLKTSAYLAASMTQQISNTRSDKQLTAADLARITYACCLNFFHTNTMFNPWPFGISYSINFIYVKRLNSNSYQYQSSWGSTESGVSPVNMGRYVGGIPTKKLSEIENVNTDLVCSRDGEEKLFLNCTYRRMLNFDKSKIGLFLLDPQMVKGGMHTTNRYPDLLYYQIVISPKPGLFPARN